MISNCKSDFCIPAPKDYPFSLAVFSFCINMNSDAYAVYLASKISNKSTKKYRKPYQLNRYFYQLAGLELDMVVVKWGDRLLLNVEFGLFHLNMTEKKRLELYALAQDLLFEGQYEQGRFPQSFFEEEKVNQQKEIEMLMSNPIEWHFQLFMEKMFPNDPFRYSLLGTKEQVRDCTNEEIGKIQKNFIQHSQRIPVLYGTFSENETLFFQELASQGKVLSENVGLQVSRKPFVTYEEETTYQQTWVFLGYRHPIDQNHRLYPALHIYNQILGKLPASVLYTRLREKSGLCYSIGSSLPFGKEVLFIIASIAYKDKEIFLEELEKALLSLSNFTKKQQYLKLAKNRILSNLQGWKDYPMARLNFELEIKIKKASYTYSSYIQAIEKVTWEDLEEISKCLWLDTLYICKGNRQE